MATVNGLSIFPPPRVPRLATPNPHNRKPSLKAVAPQTSVKESVVIALEEVRVDTLPAELPPQIFVQGPDSEIQTAVSSSPLGYEVPPPPPRPLSQNNPYRSKKKPTQSTPSSTQSSAQSSPEPESVSSSDTLVRSSSDEGTVVSSVVPMRSMFPVYNPSVPLTHQNYYPQQPLPAYSAHDTSLDSLRSVAQNYLGQSSRNSYASRTNGTSMVDVPLDELNFRIPTYSSCKELENLWEATQGIEIDASAPVFDLEMGRTAEATFAFGSSPGSPFYTATTYDTAEISITKTNPRRRNITCDVVLASMEAPSRRSPPNDGLVSFIFPKLAAMLAINQSHALAEESGIPAENRDEVLEAALKRAANQEASSLRWNPIDKRYQLEHPGMARKTRDPNFVLSPSSPQNEAEPLIHITVTTSPDTAQDQPVILVTCPASLLPPSATISPAVEATNIVQLASLDFNTNTLHIEANNILKVMPSCFAVDSIVSAIITVAVADYRPNLAMGGMKIWKPKPAKQEGQTWADSPRSIGTGPFYATIAEREDAEAEARAAAQNHRKTKKSFKFSAFSDLPTQEVDLETGRTWYGRSKAEKSKRKQIVVGEFDMDKLSHYQSGTRQGQELPAITRGLLGVLITGLKFIVWILTMIVQSLCWILVRLTRGVTSEKF